MKLIILKFFFLFAIVLTATGVRAALPSDQQMIQADVGLATKYIYNVYFDALRSVNDAAMDVTPELHIHPKVHFFTWSADGTGLYEQYATSTIQNHIDGQGKAQLTLNQEGQTAFRLFASDNSFSDPSPTETFGRIPRNQLQGGTGIKFKGSKGTALDLKVLYSAETFAIPSLSQFNATHLYDNNSVDGVVEFSNQFLPETSWFLRASGGQKIFPNKPVFDPSTSLVFKNDSIYALAEGGFVGRLSERSTIDFALGWLYRNYSEQTPAPYNSFDTYSAPVFNARFAEQVTRRDQFTLGYDYKVDDSYYTNYYVDQEIYAGLVRVLGDQVLVLGRLGYDYRSYSLPLQRNDVRITASFSIKYSLSKTVKVTADLKADLLSSDAYDNTIIPVSPDRPLSYNAGTFALGLLAAF